MYKRNKYKMWNISSNMWLDNRKFVSLGDGSGVVDLKNPNKIIKDVKIFHETGHLCKNKDLIYEGDILLIHLPMGGFWGSNVKTKRLGIVKYDISKSSFTIEFKYFKNYSSITLTTELSKSSEIMGNILDSEHDMDLIQSLI